jgi:hypothetical protein
VALDSATLEAILPLAEQEQLPFFSELLREGAYGRLETLDPGRKDVLWATAITGRWPYQHGVLGQAAYPAPLHREDALLSLLPVGLSFASWGVFGAEPQTVDATWFKVLPMWTALSRLGYETGIVGWRTLDPVPQASRFAFSHQFFLGATGQRWAHPELLAERALLFRTPSSEISWDHVDGFGEKIPRTLKKPLAADLWREAVTLFLLEQDQEVEAVFLYLPGLRTASSRFFGGFADLQFDGKTNPRTHNANAVLSSYYRHLDRFLQKLWSLQKGPRILAVVSACGASRPTGAMRVRNWINRGRSTRGLVDRGEDGLLILRGEGIRPGTLMARSNIIDVAPTVLYGLGLPVARDLPGQILTEAFDPTFLAHRPLTFLPSYEVLGESPR